MGGFITLHRKLIDWEWYTDTNVKVLFIHMLLRANHKDRSYRGVEIKRGSFTSSIQVLSSETGLSVQEVRTALKKLQTTKEVTCETTSKFSMYTIEKYESYQGEQHAKQHAKQQASNMRNNKRATCETTTNNKVNNVTSKQCNNITTSVNGQAPSKSQIEFAKDLGIDFENKSMKELAVLINEAMKEKPEDDDDKQIVKRNWTY